MISTLTWQENWHSDQPLYREIQGDRNARTRANVCANGVLQPRWKGDQMAGDRINCLGIPCIQASLYTEAKGWRIHGRKYSSWIIKLKLPSVVLLRRIMSIIYPVNDGPKCARMSMERIFATRKIDVCPAVNFPIMSDFYQSLNGIDRSQLIHKRSAEINKRSHCRTIPITQVR